MCEILELLQEALDELRCAHGASGVDDKHIAYASRRLEDVLRMLTPPGDEFVVLSVESVFIPDDPRYTITDIGKAFRDAMQRGAKLNGGVKAGEDK